MKHINLDHEDERIKRFVHSLTQDPDGSVLELEGEALLRVMPARDEPVDEERLKQAILRRRDESRGTNADWEASDRRK